MIEKNNIEIHLPEAIMGLMNGIYCNSFANFAFGKN
jgi:hypothetical protein